MRLLFPFVMALALWSATARADYLAGVRAMQARDFPTAYSEWSIAAKAGDARAQYRLGQIYELGLGVPQNWAAAYRWYASAAAGGVAEASAARDDLASRMARDDLAKAQQDDPQQTAGEGDADADADAPAMTAEESPVPQPDEAALNQHDGAWELWLFTNLAVGRCQRIARVIDLVIEDGKTTGKIAHSTLGPHAYSGEVDPKDSSLRLIAFGQEQVKFFGKLRAT
ncbi:MAG: hypothetical protein O3A51_14575, partial [Verrucomicrobia bacterium]|nr:hypothetical protein [Verrucomicrobiota bacterium]